MARIIDKAHPAVIVVLGISVLVALELQSTSERKAEPLHYRGELRASDGRPIMGAHVIGVELWNAAEDGERLCAVQPQSISVDHGQFSLQLTDACAGALQRGRGAWADLQVDGERLLPRAQLMAAQISAQDSPAPVVSEPTPVVPRAQGAEDPAAPSGGVSEPNDARESNFRI